MTEATRAHNLASLLVRTARAWPALPAVALGRRMLHDYASLVARVARLAEGLRAAACGPGDRVVVLARNTPAFLEALFACWWTGCVAVPVNAKLHAAEAQFVLDDSGARLVFADDAWARALAGATRVVTFDGAEYARLLACEPSHAPVPVAPDAAAWLFYTSGTTGRPKGAVLTHANLHAMAHAFLADVEPVAAGDSIVHAAPMSHGSGLYAVPHVARAAVNVVPESGGFEPDEIADLVDEWGRALLFAAPTMVKRLVASSRFLAVDRTRLRSIVYGGGPMYVADARAAHAALGPCLAQIYGQGESPMTITAMDRAMLADAIARGDESRIGSVGIAQPGIEILIAAPDGTALETGEAGEVLVRGPSVMREYWRNPSATAAALRGGWLHTGDVGVLDASGMLMLKDRSKDLIISGGANIYPREVEEVLLAHADVAEAAVVGRRHAEWGEEVVACVVARRPLDDAARRALEQALDAACLGAIARFKRPRSYVFVDALPKNDTGKVLKRALRERLDSAPP